MEGYRIPPIMFTEKQANALILRLLCHIQLFGRQGFNDKGARWISLSKTKKTSLSSFLPACRASDAREQESAMLLKVNPFLSVLGFRFTTSQIPT